MLYAIDDTFYSLVTKIQIGLRHWCISTTPLEAAMGNLSLLFLSEINCWVKKKFLGGDLSWEVGDILIQNTLKPSLGL